MSARALQETSIRYFLEVVRCGSITEAAERLNVVPSAVSKQIARLEANLNTTLFERRARGMTPSAAGELLAAYAFRNQLESERVNNEIIALQGLHRGEVRVASTAGYSMEFLPRLIVEFRQRHPGISFQLDVNTAPEITRKLKEAEIDIGLTFSQIPQAGLKVACRIALPVTVVLPRSHPLSGRQSLSLAQLSGQVIGMPARHIMLRQIIDACCSSHSISLNIEYSTGSVSALLAFARFQGGAVIAVGQLLKHYLAENDMVCIPLKDKWIPPLSLEMHTLLGRTLPQPVQVFLDCVKAELQQLSTPAAKP